MNEKSMRKNKDFLPLEPTCQMGKGELIGLLAFIILLSGLVHYGLNLTFDLKRINNSIIYDKAKMIESLNKKVNWIILGDSTGLFGFVPLQWDEYLNTSSLNISTVASTSIISEICFFQMLREKEILPNYIILIRSVFSWRVKNVAEGLILPLDWAKRIESIYPMNVETRWPSLRFIASHLFSPRHWLLSKTLENNEKFIKGYLLKRKRSPEDDFEESLKKCIQRIDESFYLTESNKAALDYLQQEAEETKVHIFLINSPFAESFINTKEFTQYLTELHDNLKSYNNNFFHVLTDVHINISDEKMYDPQHTLFLGAKQYTTKLADQIQSYKLKLNI